MTEKFQTEKKRGNVAALKMKFYVRKSDIKVKLTIPQNYDPEKIRSLFITGRYFSHYARPLKYKMHK